MDKYRTFRRYRHGAGLLSGYREAALCEAENKSGALVRVEPEKLAVETVSPQSSSGGIVIRAHGVEVEFPSGTDIEMLATFVKALNHA